MVSYVVKVAYCVRFCLLQIHGYLHYIDMFVPVCDLSHQNCLKLLCSAGQIQWLLIKRGTYHSLAVMKEMWWHVQTVLNLYLEPSRAFPSLSWENHGIIHKISYPGLSIDLCTNMLCHWSCSKDYKHFPIYCAILFLHPCFLLNEYHSHHHLIICVIPLYHMLIFIV